MIIYANSRRSGKSTEAIKIAASTHSLLVVPTRDCVKLAEDIGREIKYPVVAISAAEYFKKLYRDGCRRNYTDRVVIDELEWCLREVFRCEITMATTTGFVGEIQMSEAVEIKYKEPKASNPEYDQNWKSKS